MSRLSRPLAGLTLCAASLFGLNSCKEEEPEKFGFTCIHLSRALSEDTDPFVGTAQIKATLKYEQCLIEYYTSKHTEQRLDGTDGPTTFEDWRERLCSESVSEPLVACEIPDLNAFQQTLQENGPASVYQMTITYNITDSSQVSDRTLLWGPGPLEAYAECAATAGTPQRPYAKATLPGDVIGLDKNGNQLWEIASFGNQTGIMQLTTGGCIQLDITKG